MGQSPHLKLTPEQRIGLWALDAELGIDITELAFPESNKSAKKVFRMAADFRERYLPTLYASFGKTRHPHKTAQEDAGMQALIQVGAPIVTLVGKASDRHARQELRVDPETNLAIITDSIRYIRSETGARVILDGEMASDGLLENPDYVHRLMELAFDAGADTFVVCDTTGRDFPYPCEDHGKMQDGVYETFRKLRRLFGWQKHLGYHGHNDRDCGTANVCAAVAGGADHAHVTRGGLSERTGMAKLEAVVGNLSQMGYDILRPGALRELTPNARRAAELLDIPIRPDAPYVGPDAFSHKAGMHTSGNSRTKEERTKAYEHIRPEEVGNAGYVILSEDAGVSTIVEFLNECTVLPPDVREELSQETNARALLTFLKEEHENGISYLQAKVSFLLRALEKFGYFHPPFRLVDTKWNADSKTGTDATVEVEMNGGRNNHHHHSPSIHKKGPVDAASAALTSALEKEFPVVQNLQLRHYNVHEISSEGTASRVQVVCNFTDGEECFYATGMDSNIIDASQAAFVDAMYYMLYKEQHRTGGHRESRGSTVEVPATVPLAAV